MKTSTLFRENIRVPISSEEKTEGILSIPHKSHGMVAFVHGSGSGRLSSRNMKVAGELNRAGLSTLLFDLLTETEADTDSLTGEFRFDIKLLTSRVCSAVMWLKDNESLSSMNIGLFGASTGAAAAVAAAAERRGLVKAVVSRGGRPDLAGAALYRVYCPILFIVGESDHFVRELNKRALEKIPAEKKLIEVPGATHLFEEPGALESASILARDWFLKYLLNE